MTNDARRSSPAAIRNREPILDVLRQYLPRHGVVLEVASGTGEHVVHFAAACGPDLAFQPSDPDKCARASIDAWLAASPSANVRPALDLDATSADWPIDRADVVVCLNMIHIAPWQAALGLMRGSARILPPGGILYLYGPFKREGRHTAPSNEAFDLDLRSRNPDWGVRDLESVVEVATGLGLRLLKVGEMPANNQSVVLQR